MKGRSGNRVVVEKGREVEVGMGVEMEVGRKVHWMKGICEEN